MEAFGHGDLRRAALQEALAPEEDLVATAFQPLGRLLDGSAVAIGPENDPGAFSPVGSGSTLMFDFAQFSFFSSGETDHIFERFDFGFALEFR